MTCRFVDTSNHVIHGSTLGVPKRDCEDRADATSELLMVFDGASSTLDAPRFQGNRYAAGAFAATLCEVSIEVALMESPEGSAADLLCNANQWIARHTPDGMAKHHRPMAAGALVRLHDDGTYTWAIAGDCQIVVYDHDGNFKALRTSYAGEQAESQRKLLREHFQEQENKRHKEEGGELRLIDINHPTLKKMYEDRVGQHNVSFPVLNGDTRFDQFMQSDTWAGEGSLENVAGFIVYTDGAAWPDTDPWDIDPIAQTVMDEGVEAYIAELTDQLKSKLFHDDIGIAIGSVVHPTDVDAY